MDSISENEHSAQASPVDLRPAGGGADDAPPPVRRRRRGLGWTARFEIAVLTGPALIVFLAFVIFPVVLAAYYGFFRWKGYGAPTDFVWFQNYKLILTDPLFHQAVGHNFFIVVLSLLMQGPVAIGLALLLNRKLRAQSVIRVLIFVPYVISEVVVGTGFSLILSSNGALNSLFSKWGLDGLREDWIASPSLAIWTLMFIITWKYVGFAVILFIAGLQGIPQELHEAAAIDGASYWQIQRRITLPLLGPTLRIWAFLSIIGSLQLFDLVYIVWGPYISATAGTSTMASYMVVNGRNAANFGYGNAVAVVLFIISLTVALIYQRFVLRRDTDGAITGGRS
jgi:multiple sugar transport system permease protein/raffinose/stachyose/melibiose transport system permease protein